MDEGLSTPVSKFLGAGNPALGGIGLATFLAHYVLVLSSHPLDGLVYLLHAFYASNHYRAAAVDLCKEGTGSFTIDGITSNHIRQG